MYNKTGTTILGVKTKEGGVLLGLDRQASMGNTYSYTTKYKKTTFTITNNATGKLEEIEIYSAVAGYASALQLYRKVIVNCFESFSTIGVSSSERFFKTLTQKITQNWSKQNPIALEVMTQSELIVVYKKGSDIDFRRFDSGGHHDSLKSNMIATGSGSMFARGAYFSQLIKQNELTKQDMQTLPKELARPALELAMKTACYLDLYSGGKAGIHDPVIDILDIS